MLRELMKKIAISERELDIDAEANGERQLSESSFSPCEYPDLEVNGELVPCQVDTLEDDQRYLPCHYFTFAGGTSTGGSVASFPGRTTHTDRIKAYQYNDIKISNDSQ
jgi:hypothetical protein